MFDNFKASYVIAYKQNHTTHVHFNLIHLIHVHFNIKSVQPPDDALSRIALTDMLKGYKKMGLEG